MNHPRHNPAASVGAPLSGVGMRAQRAKLKSCKDDETIARGKRGTSAAPGCQCKMITFPFSKSGFDP